jgi:hypothetical protein
LVSSARVSVSRRTRSITVRGRCLQFLGDGRRFGRCAGIQSRGFQLRCCG